MYFATFKKNIITALKQNALPGVFLQCLAISIALCYFFWPQSHLVFNFFGDLKTQFGWKYSLVATAIFGGLIPFLYLLVAKQINTAVFKTLLFFLLFWGYKGVEVDFLYRFQGIWFGYDLDLATIVKKTAVDQFIYSALWAAPSITIAYLWKDSGFSFSACKKKLNKSLFLIQIPTVVISNWLIWIPAVSIVYMMPPVLQIPLFNLVLCFFVLLVATLSKNHKDA